MALLLAGCQSQGGQSTPSSPAADSPIVPRLPSISELAGTPAPDILPLPALDSETISLGREVYSLHCASCHGQDLEGESDWQTQNEDGSFRAPPHDASGHTWHHGDKVLIESIKLGGERLPGNIGGFSEMPAFADVLTDDEITAVLTYIKSHWDEETRAIQWEQTAREP